MLNYSWEHFLQMSDVALAVLWHNGVPEALYLGDQFFSIGGHDECLQKMFQLVP